MYLYNTTNIIKTIIDTDIIIYELLLDLLIFENISLIFDSNVTSGLLFSLLIEFLIFNNHIKKFSFDLSASSNVDIFSFKFSPHVLHGSIYGNCKINCL